MEKKLRINRQIRLPEIRLIDENGEQAGVVKTNAALERAMTLELDLVEISPHAKPPVCKIMDYGKFKFDQSKRLREQKKRQTRVQLKEIKMRPKIDNNDYNVKVNRIKDFLGKGDKVRVTLQFRGREMAHIDIGERIMNRVKEELKEITVIEKEPRLEGRQMTMIISPKATNKPKTN